MKTLHNPLFWVFLSLNAAIFFLIIGGPIPAIPSTIVTVYFIVKANINYKKQKGVDDEN